MSSEDATTPSTEENNTATSPSAGKGEAEEAAPATPFEPDYQVVPIVVPEGHHGLNSGWTFWYDKRAKKSNDNNWEESLVDLGTFTTIEGFWDIYTHLQRASSLPNRSSYHLFRNHVAPMWESFPDGGCWILTIKKKCGLLDRVWEELLLSVIGELFDEGTVVGVGVSMRSKGDRLSIWNSDSQNHTVRFAIREKLKTLLTITENISRTIEYKDNSDSIRDRSTFRNAKSYQFIGGGSNSGGGGSKGKGKSKGGNKNSNKNSNNSPKAKDTSKKESGEEAAAPAAEAAT